MPWPRQITSPASAVRWDAGIHVPSGLKDTTLALCCKDEGSVVCSRGTSKEDLVLNWYAGASHSRIEDHLQKHFNSAVICISSTGPAFLPSAGEADLEAMGLGLSADISWWLVGDAPRAQTSFPSTRLRNTTVEPTALQSRLQRSHAFRSQQSCGGGAGVCEGLISLREHAKQQNVPM